MKCNFNVKNDGTNLPQKDFGFEFFFSNDHIATCPYCHLATSDQQLEIPI